MRFVMAVTALLCLAAAPQEIYRWVDKDGIVHYSDQPGSPNAELVELADPSSYESAEATVEYPSPSAPRYTPPPSQYESLQIVSPARDQTFFGSDTEVRVTAAVGGSLQPEHEVVFYVDDIRRPATDGLSLTLHNVYRGTHYVRASIIDEAGVAVITSEQIPFHVQQRSTQNPRTRNQPTVAKPRPVTPPRPPPPGG